MACSRPPRSRGTPAYVWAHLIVVSDVCVHPRCKVKALHLRHTAGTACYMVDRREMQGTGNVGCRASRISELTNCKCAAKACRVVDTWDRTTITHNLHRSAVVAEVVVLGAQHRAHLVKIAQVQNGVPPPHGCSRANQRRQRETHSCPHCERPSWPVLARLPAICVRCARRHRLLSGQCIHSAPALRPAHISDTNAHERLSAYETPWSHRKTAYLC